MNDAQQASPPTEGPEPLHPDDDSSEIDLIGIFGLPQAPIFYPSEQEFQDPWKYLQTIRDKITKTGICVIQPPNQNWDFDTFRKCVNPKTFQFETKAQNVHQMQHRNGPNTDFLARLKRYWKNKKRPLNSLPIINGTIVDLYQLTNQVKDRGGLDEVIKSDNWKVIAAELRVTSLEQVDLAAVKELEKCYNDLLLPFAKYEAKKSPKKKKNPKTEEKMEEDGVEVVNRNTRPKRKAALNTTANSPYKASNKRPRSKSPSPKKKGKQTKKRKMNEPTDEPLWKQVKSRSFTKETCENSSSEEAMSEDSEEEGVNDFGYQNGQSFTLEKFQKMADEFETKWQHCKTPLDKEREYWRVVQSAEHWVQVQYGSDLDVANHSTGFPLNKDSKDVSVRQRARAFEKDRKKWKLPETTPYMSKTGWNTNNLSGATFLHHIDESVGGLTRPMLYVGMLFSSFCWHVEDNYLYSINYLHTGKPKLWYGVPGSAAQNFEETFRKVFPDLFKKNPNLLHLLITQLPPKFLKEAGVPVCTTLQNQGQFVVTCPRSFHGGFNTGFNCAESVNFALEDWLPFCEQACQDYRFQRSSVFPYEEFILKASQNPDNPLIQEMLLSELKRIIANEDQARKRISSLGIESVVINTTKTPPKSRNKNKTGYQSCTECGFDCYLSSVICSKHPDRLVCLNDVERLCSCSNSHKSLQIRKTMDELNRFATNLESSVPSGS